VTANRVIGFLLGLFAALMALVHSKRSAAFDLAMTLRFQARQTPVIDVVMAAVSWPGFPPQSRIIPPAIVAAWLARGHRRAAAFQFAAWGGAAISTAVKALIQRPRPLPPEVRVVVAPLGGTSFPSGHVLTYVGFYGFLAFLLADYLHDGALRNASVATLTGLLAAIGPSRIERGHHWTTDVIASYLLGLAFLLGLIEVYQRTSRRSILVRLVGAST
jgi:membrane-associated phospholipid phosphatase